MLFSEIKEVEEGNTSDGMAGDGQVDRQLIDNLSWSLFFSPTGRSSLQIPYDRVSLANDCLMASQRTPRSRTLRNSRPFWGLTTHCFPFFSLKKGGIKPLFLKGASVKGGVVWPAMTAMMTSHHSGVLKGACPEGYHGQVRMCLSHELHSHINGATKNPNLKKIHHKKYSLN